MNLSLQSFKSQCKKQETPATPEAEGDMVHITLKANGGDRHIVYPSTGAVEYRPGDRIYVGDGSKCLGYLQYDEGRFHGDITLFGEPPYTWAVIVDFTDQLIME